MLLFNAFYTPTIFKKKQHKNHTMTINPVLLFGTFYTPSNLSKNQSPHVLRFNAIYISSIFKKKQKHKNHTVTINLMLRFDTSYTYQFFQKKSCLKFTPPPCCSLAH